MRDANFLEKTLSVLLGLVVGLFSLVGWVIRGVAKIIHRISIDILKNIYGRIIAVLATLVLVGLGLSSFANLPH